MNPWGWTCYSGINYDEESASFSISLFQNGNSTGSPQGYDNDGYECAQAFVSGQVQGLPEDDFEDSNHFVFGQNYYCDGEEPWPCYEDDSEESEAEYGVPSPPNMPLSNIDATNANGVVFSYSVDGTPPYSGYLDLGGGYYYTNSTNPMTFTADQNAYPTGAPAAQVYGYMYGITFTGGPPCGVGVNEGVDPGAQSSDGYVLFTGGSGNEAIKTCLRFFSTSQPLRSCQGYPLANRYRLPRCRER